MTIPIINVRSDRFKQAERRAEEIQNACIDANTSATDRMLRDAAAYPDDLNAQMDAGMAKLSTLPGVWWRKIEVTYIKYENMVERGYRAIASRRGNDEKNISAEGGSVAEAVDVCCKKYAVAELERDIAARIRRETEMVSRISADITAAEQVIDCRDNCYPHTEMEGGMS